MKIIIAKDYDEMSLEASKVVEEQIKNKQDSVIGLATGGTPEGMYKLLINSSKNGNLDWSNIKTFNLDEYIGLSNTHPLSYHAYMKEKLFDHINIKLENTHVPKGDGNASEDAKHYEKELNDAGGVDLQVLGIGANSHIAFNEPGSTDKEFTRVVDLTQSTIDANSRYFDSKADVPKQAMTMGIGTILRAKKIILLASGVDKAQAIADTLANEPTPNVPSSYLKNHKDVTLIIDEAAASLLKEDK